MTRCFELLAAFYLAGHFASWAARGFEILGRTHG